MSVYACEIQTYGNSMVIHIKLIHTLLISVCEAFVILSVSDLGSQFFILIHLDFCPPSASINRMQECCKFPFI